MVFNQYLNCEVRIICVAPYSEFSCFFEGTMVSEDDEYVTLTSARSGGQKYKSIKVKKAVILSIGQI